MIKFELKHPRATQEMLGFLPEFWSEHNPASAKEQANRSYAHGGGWQQFKGFQMAGDFKSIRYPGDPPMPLIAQAKLRNETILLFDCAWVAIVQEDGSYEICRMD